MKLEMVDRACPVCGSRDESKVFAQADFDEARWDSFAFSSRKLPEYMHYRLLECPVCDLLYSSPVPTAKSLESAYQVAAFDSGEEAAYASHTYARLLPAVRRKLKDQVGALDVGTGDGAFLSRLLEQGFTQVAGIEPSAAPIRAARVEVRPLIRQGSFRATDFPPESQSLITCFQTLEHLSDPLAFCQGAFSLLKPGGAALFVCHNWRALSARFLGLRSPIFDIEHLQLFSPDSALHLLRQIGLQDVECSTLFNRYPLRYWTRLFPLPAALKSGALGLLGKTGLGRLPVPLPAGNFAVVGYKRGQARRESLKNADDTLFLKNADDTLLR